MNNTAVICFTNEGSKIAYRIKNETGGVVYGSSRVKMCDKAIEDLKCEMARIFEGYSHIIFVSAVGIAVRLIAPLLKDKFTDPPVLVVDEKGIFVISLLSGHIGGANSLAERIAGVLGAVPVITTATDLNNKFAVDLFAKKNQLLFDDRALLKEISACILDGKKIGFWSDYPVRGDLSCFSQDASIGIAVSHKSIRPFRRTLLLKPKNLVLGIGCKKGISYDKLLSSVESVLNIRGYGIGEVDQIRSINRKSSEPAILKLAEKTGAKAIFYSSEELNSVKGDFNSSSFVQEIVNVDNVCERSAAFGNCRILVRKQICSGITVAVSESSKEIVI